MAADAGLSMPPGGFVSRNGGNSQPRLAPLPHIDDLVAVPKDIDPNSSIRKLLESAEGSLRQSEMSRDFNRPALALKDYIRASIIAVQTVTKHQDYPVFRSQQSDLARLHNNLLRRIDQQSDVYENIKRDIIADNKRSGIQPTTRQSVPQAHNGDRTSRPLRQTQLNGQMPHLTNGSSMKSKPAVHPKPPSLHGKAIQPGHKHSASTGGATVDLATRFANLRGPQASPGQDPRIKTYPIIPQRPQGPRKMTPSPQKININTDGAAALPKLPDAIYSPARGSVSGEASRLPTSTPRGPFGRTTSSTSLTGTPSASQPLQSNEYFPPAPTVPPPSVPVKTLIDIPEGDYITAEQLYAVTQSKASILFIDIRSREAFDKGHIMASSIVCIEPSMLTRQAVSAAEISDSLVLSPNSELSLFERRSSFDLVVYYDQASERIARSPKSPNEEAIFSLQRALVLLNYGSELKAPPRLLQGGLDAWTDLMGSHSLQATSSDRSKASVTKALDGKIRNQRSTFTVTPLPSQDIKKWQDNVEADAVRHIFPRTGDEFFRSPPNTVAKQSMAPRMPNEQLERHELAHQFSAPSQLPPPPARPQAAVQRPSHSGVSPGDQDEGEYAGQAKKATEQPVPTGLNNPGNWCYANSTLQSLLASPKFGRELADRAWEVHYKGKVPTKSKETRAPPQLMIQILSNLFHWMDSGKFGTLKAQILMDYSKHLCVNSEQKFGGPAQQDAQEFMSFLMDQLHEETNLLRHLEGPCSQPDTTTQLPIQAAQTYWQNHCKLNDSLVDRYWRGLLVSTVQCQRCKTKSYTFEKFEWLSVVLDDKKDMELTEALQKTQTGSELSDYACDQCKSQGRAVQKMTLARMPQLLCISLGRFSYANHSSQLIKKNVKVSWDFNDFDFTPFFLDPASTSNPPPDDDDKGFHGPFKYECYAVIVHSGASLNQGHYYAYVRDSSSHGQHTWYRCNDNIVHKVRIGSRHDNDMQKDVFRKGENDVPYLLFFRRKNA